MSKTNLSEFPAKRNQFPLEKANGMSYCQSIRSSPKYSALIPFVYSNYTDIENQYSEGSKMLTMPSLAALF